MKRIVMSAVAAAAALVLSANAAFAETKEIKFGCYIPLTGQLAIFGKSMQNGFKMALEDFEKSKMGKGLKFTIQCEDDAGRADDGINIARKFIEDKSIVAVIGSWSSTVTLAAGRLYNKAKLVDITPISSHPAVTKIGPYVYRQSVIQSKEGAANGANMYKLGARKIAMLGIPNDYGKANMGFTKRSFLKAGGKVVFEEFVRPDAQDFRQTLQKAARAKPDMIYIGAFAPQAALMLKQMRQMGIKTPVYLAAADDTPDLVRLAGKEAVEGVHLTLLFNPVLGKETADFFKRYEAEFGRKPDPFAGNAYQTAMMMMEIAAKQAPNVTREGMRKGLDAMRHFTSAYGPLTYDPKTREWDYHFRLGVVKDGRTVLVK
jgi:branched-chain amino acid transport system substrate-binding protein